MLIATKVFSSLLVIVGVVSLLAMLWYSVLSGFDIAKARVRIVMSAVALAIFFLSLTFYFRVVYEISTEQLWLGIVIGIFVSLLLLGGSLANLAIRQHIMNRKQH